jgi:hypothetical protein
MRFRGDLSEPLSGHYHCPLPRPVGRCGPMIRNKTSRAAVEVRDHGLAKAGSAWRRRHGWMCSHTNDFTPPWLSRRKTSDWLRAKDRASWSKCIRRACTQVQRGELSWLNNTLKTTRNTPARARRGLYVPSLGGSHAALPRRVGPRCSSHCCMQQ